MSDPESVDRAAAYHLRIQGIAVPVTDLARSIRFFETIGFTLLRKMAGPDQVRLAAVAPPDGLSTLLLVEGYPDPRVGTPTGIAFVTDDIAARYREWTALGVKFEAEPRSLVAGLHGALFFDPDGNGFRLAEVDTITRQLEVERQRTAERLEADRRAAYELDLATQIQAGLFPRRRPQLATLECVGVCIQARQVGGDYFDFLASTDVRLGLVVGDVSGKGIGAALLMATLQASLRGQYARDADDLPGLLRAVNATFFGNSPGASYATLFLGTYDDATRRVTFINCGHPPAVVLRRDGSVEMLHATSYVLGMFESWDGASREVELAAGDVLAIYSDGVSEAAGRDGSEFGVEGLVAALRASQGRGAQEQLDAVIAAVRAFSDGSASDDITLLLARGV